MWDMEKRVTMGKRDGIQWERNREEERERERERKKIRKEDGIRWCDEREIKIKKIDEDKEK